MMDYVNDGMHKVHLWHYIIFINRCLIRFGDGDV